MSLGKSRVAPTLLRDGHALDTEYRVLRATMHLSGQQDSLVLGETLRMPASTY